MTRVSVPEETVTGSVMDGQVDAPAATQIHKGVGSVICGYFVRSGQEADVSCCFKGTQQDERKTFNMKN